MPKRHGSARNVVLADFRSTKLHHFQHEQSVRNQLNDEGIQYAKVGRKSGGHYGRQQRHWPCRRAEIHQRRRLRLHHRAARDRAGQSEGRTREEFTSRAGRCPNLADLDRLYATIKAEKGALDIILASAAFVEVVPTAFVTPEHFDKTFNTNARGTFFTVQKGLPLLRNGGSIVLVSSGAHLKGIPFLRYVLGDQGGHSLVRPELGSRLKRSRYSCQHAQPGTHRYADHRGPI
jgi:hypothetical protein